MLSKEDGAGAGTGRPPPHSLTPTQWHYPTPSRRGLGGGPLPIAACFCRAGLLLGAEAPTPREPGAGRWTRPPQQAWCPQQGRRLTTSESEDGGTEVLSAPARLQPPAPPRAVHHPFRQRDALSHVTRFLICASELFASPPVHRLRARLRCRAASLGLCGPSPPEHPPWPRGSGAVSSSRTPSSPL